MKKSSNFLKITADTGYLLQNPYFLYDRRKVETVFHESVKSQASVPVLYDPCSNTVVKKFRQYENDYINKDCFYDLTPRKSLFPGNLSSI